MEGFELKPHSFVYGVSGRCRTLQRRHPLCRVSSHAEGMLFFVLRFVSRQMGCGARGGSGQDGFDGQFTLAPAEEGVEQAQAREARQGGGGEIGVEREYPGR